MANYAFRPLTRAEYLMIRGWLNQPHIGGWWGAPDHEIGLMDEELGMGRCDMRIVEADGVPFAFVQDYDARTWEMPHYADLPQGARGLDTFLGDPAFLGRGHAAGYLRARAEDLARRYPTITVDPSPDNTRAVATYRRAGFEGDQVLPCEDGDPVLVLTFEGKTST